MCILSRPAEPSKTNIACVLDTDETGNGCYTIIYGCNINSVMLPAKYASFKFGASLTQTKTRKRQPISSSQPLQMHMILAINNPHEEDPIFNTTSNEIFTGLYKLTNNSVRARSYMTEYSQSKSQSYSGIVHSQVGNWSLAFCRRLEDILAYDDVDDYPKQVLSSTYSTQPMYSFVVATFNPTHGKHEFEPLCYTMSFIAGDTILIPTKHAHNQQDEQDGLAQWDHQIYFITTTGIINFKGAVDGAGSIITSKVDYDIRCNKDTIVLDINQGWSSQRFDQELSSTVDSVRDLLNKRFGTLPNRSEPVIINQPYRYIARVDLNDKYYNDDIFIVPHK